MLEEYDSEVVYKPGKLNENADALSRIHPIDSTSHSHVMRNLYNLVEINPNFKDYEIIVCRYQIRNIQICVTIYYLNQGSATCGRARHANVILRKINKL